MVYMKCKEYLCNGNVPEVKKGALTSQRQIEAFACHQLRMCRYCYRMRFGFGEHSHGKVRQGLNSAQIRERHLRIHREPAKRFYQPSFYKEWLEFWKTWWMGYTPD
jgi:hypothetical protein